MLDIPHSTGLSSEKAVPSLAREMFALAVRSPNLLEGKSTTRTLHESPIFSLNGTPCKLRYSYIDSRTEGSAIGSALVQITTPEGVVLATHRQSFSNNWEANEQNGKPELLIGGKIYTDKQYRGNGYGSALIEVMDDKIRYTMQTRDELRGKHALCLLADESETRWTSFQAERAGFKNVGENLWLKVY